MLQAALSDSLFLDLFPFSQNGFVATEVDIGGRGIPALLEVIGIDGIQLIYTPFAVLVGIVYGYLPLMVFPIYVSLDRLDKRLLEASSDLGATPLTTFFRVTLPMSISGMATGCMLVFILLMGEFLIPALLGRQGVLCRQCAGRSVPSVAELGLWIGRRGDADRDHACDRHPLHAPYLAAEYTAR